MGRFEHLRIRQVDSSLEPLRHIRDVSPPDAGWARTIREALGMSIRQLAERMGVAKTTVATLERNEASGAIKLGSLKALGEALDCDLVYALVPRTSLEETVRKRARRVAERTVRRVSYSMELEEQGIPVPEWERQVAEHAERLWHDPPRDLWDDPL
ncbi:mobile mystery protein A [Gemmatimonadota bacterium]